MVKVIAAILFLLLAVPVYAQEGSEGLGDTIFPLEGNGGIDVLSYDLNIRWDDQTGAIDASAFLEILPTQALDSFNLDFGDFEITSITIDDEDATYDHDGTELTITPVTPIQQGDIFEVIVRYSGVPGVTEGSITSGWTQTENGVFVMAEPIAAKGWFPNNNHPRDAAIYRFAIIVPEQYEAVANGLPQEPTINNDDTITYAFVAANPMPSYLVTVAIGDFRLESSEGSNGIQIQNYFFEDATEATTAPFERFPEMLELFEGLFGAYPFEIAGNLVVPDELGFALEIQGMSLFGSVTAEYIVAHELAHQWFGDYIRLDDWSQIWLKEGFASYGEALWEEHLNGADGLDAWVKTKYESLIGIQHIPVADLNDFLNYIQIMEMNITRDQAARFIQVVADVDEATLNTALADIGEEGISNRALPPILESLGIEELTLTLLKFRDSFVLLAGQEPADLPPLETDEIVMLLAPPPGVVDSSEAMYSSGTYGRAALGLHALRLRVGDETFFTILQTYVKEFGGTTATTDDFIGVAEAVSGQELDDWYQAWYVGTQMPDIPELGLLRENYS